MIRKVRLSALVLFLIITVFGVQFGSRISKVVSGENTCVCDYDGFGYYMYLPALVDRGNLYMTPEWAQDLQNNYCDSAEAYQLYLRDNGNQVNIYHMGLAFLQLPAYALADGVAAITGFPRDGFSKPYHIAFLLNAYLFVILGAVFLLKLLRLYFSELTVGLLLLIAFFGTNYYMTTIDTYQLQHHFLFALFAAFGYHLLKAVKAGNFSGRHFYFAVLLFGLAVAIRPTHALLGLFPFVLLWGKLASRKQFWGKILLFPLSAFVWNIPQLLYWKLVGGSWLLLNLHVEELIVTDPNWWSFLFSFRKGWLIYTPVFLLLIPAFYVQLKQQKRLGWSVLLTLFVFVWVLSSWECWWYAGSFGSRVMIDFYPLLFLTLGFLFETVKKRARLFAAVLTFTALTFLLNGFQSLQFSRGILHYSRMSYDHYRYIFGRLSFESYDDHRLLIDRNNVQWADRVPFYKDQRLDMQELFALKKPLTAEPGTDLSIAKFPFLGPLKTDETLMEAELEYTIFDSTKSSVLKLEMVSRYNAYRWESHELALGLPNNVRQKMRFRFNLAEINHRKDQLQVYIDNDFGGQIILHSMKLTAVSLIRD